MYGGEQTKLSKFAKKRSESRCAQGRQKIPGMRHIEERRGFVVVDFRGRNSHELSEIYEAFALLCARGKVRAALFRTGEEDADYHFTLRDALATVARIVGVPLSLRLAVVADSAPIEVVYRSMRGELRVLGCDARTFRSARSAGKWLSAADERVAPRRAGGAVALA